VPSPLDTLAIRPADALRLLTVIGVQDLATPERNTAGER